MKPVLLAIALSQFPFLVGIAVGLKLGADLGAKRARKEAVTQQQSLQSSLDHERNLNWLLSQRIGEMKEPKL